MSGEDNLFQQLVEQDDITWQVMIQELVKTEQMDPWDIDLSIISEKFLTFIEKMKETNLRISGKIILAAALLLRLKSGRFIDTDLVQLENLMNEDYDEFEEWRKGVRQLDDVLVIGVKVLDTYGGIDFF